MLDSERLYLIQSLGREPTDVEEAIVSAEWSEHCSYKSSKQYIRTLPHDAPHVVTGAGLDSGVIDAGDGYVLTAHIESHNHPSAVEPYGGAATGVGGIIRDIISAGTRPIAILDGLRFGMIDADPHAAWLLRDAVRGIADYGNCLGIPTVSGETAFDECYTGYALVDVGAVGFGRTDKLIRNRAEPGDHMVLIGGPTGYDGVGGAQFASDQLESEDRSAVQIPDPFIEKMMLEVVLECRSVMHALKDLGGGGLACAVSETADSLGVGISMDTDMVHTRSSGMSPSDIMVSESQERMLCVVDDDGLAALQRSCKKFRVPCSVIGKVDDTGEMLVTHSGRAVARMPACLVAHAPLLDWPVRQPYTTEDYTGPPPLQDYTDTIKTMMGGPHQCSRHWIYSQYDHEVGIRTVRRPGGDSPLLRLDNGRYLAISMDGNPDHCQMNPYHGAMGCFEEACRNVRCTGADPVAMLDHLQFGSPENPHIMWGLSQSVRALRRYSLYTKIPCIGGKVSLYNETDRGPIKHSPVIMVMGLAATRPATGPAAAGDTLFVVGHTRAEMGGSTYHTLRGHIGGICPRVDMAASVRNGRCMTRLVREGVVHTIHDISAGGLAAAVSRMCIDGRVGCTVDMACMPDHPTPPMALFSESHSRYLLAVSHDAVSQCRRILDSESIPYGMVGVFDGDAILMETAGRQAARLMVDKVLLSWGESLEAMVRRG